MPRARQASRPARRRTTRGRPAPPAAWTVARRACDATRMEVNGMAHVILTVSDFTAARAFYGELLPFLGLQPVLDAEAFFYCVGGRTARGISPAAPEHRGERFVQQRVGLHHLCFRVRERADVDAVHDLVC